jgi:hypothetical protein
MEWHFGYNCKNFLPIRARAAGQPPFQKCRELIDSYRKRNDLVEQKWLNAPELFVYLNLSKEELLRQITSGEIRTRLQKDGRVAFCVSAAWQYDDCLLASSGGQCLYFEKHNGKTISCLAQLESLDAEHPNAILTPSEADIRTFEDDVIRIVGAT